MTNSREMGFLSKKSPEVRRQNEGINELLNRQLDRVKSIFDSNLSEDAKNVAYDFGLALQKIQEMLGNSSSIKDPSTDKGFTTIKHEEHLESQDRAVARAIAEEKLKGLKLDNKLREEQVFSEIDQERDKNFYAMSQRRNDYFNSPSSSEDQIIKDAQLEVTKAEVEAAKEKDLKRIENARKKLNTL